MTTTASGRRQTTACNGVTVDFPVNFQFEANGELFVYLGVTPAFDPAADTLLTEGVDYTITGSGRARTAIVTTAIAQPAGKYLTRYRVTSRAQTADFVVGDGIGADKLETAIDRLALIEEEQDEEIDEIGGRALLVPHGETAPAVASLAGAEGKVLAIVGGKVTPIANNTAAVAADVLAAHNDRVASDADAVVAAAALATVGPYALANVLRRLAVLEDEIRSFLPVLTTASAAYHNIYGTYLLVPTYTGPLLRVIRNSDGVEVDLFPTGKTISPGDIKTLRGAGDVLRITKWYDQSGGARHATQTVTARQPGLHEDAYWNGAPVILGDGGVAFIGGPGGRGFDIPAAITGRACAFFAATDFKQSTDRQFLFAFVGATGRALFHSYTDNGAIVHDATTRSVFKQKQFRAGQAVYAIREKAAAPLDLFIDGVATAAVATDLASPGPTPPSETLGPGLLGYTAAAGFANYQPNFRMTAFVTISGASPNDADMIAVTRCLQSNVALSSRLENRVVFIGNSIIAGGANRLTLDEMWYWRRQTLKGMPEVFNLGIPGKTLLACYNDRATFDGVLYKSGDPVVYVLAGPSNDINGGTTAATLYGTTLPNYITYLRGLGSNVRVVVCTILQRGDYSAGKEAERVAFNTWLRANWSTTLGADALCDVDATLAAVDANYVANNTILGDTVGPLIHPTSHGYELQAPTYAAAYNAVVP